MENVIAPREEMLGRAASHLARALHLLRNAYVTDQSDNVAVSGALRTLVERCEHLLIDDESGLLNFLGRQPLPAILEREPQAAGVYTVEYLDGKSEKTFVYSTGPIGVLDEGFVTSRQGDFAYASPLAALMACSVYSGTPPGGKYQEL